MVERSKPTIAAQIHSVMDNGGKSCGITKFQLASENADVCFMSTTVRQAITDWLVPKGYSIGPYSDHQTLMVSWK